MLTNKELTQFLKQTSVNLSFIDKLKVYYRPLVCPLNTLLSYLKPGEKVFDIGCGSGQFSLLVAHYCKPKKIFGIEISQTLVTNARALLHPYRETLDYTFEYFDGITIPDAINEYDTIFMIDVVHHIPKDGQRAFIKQLYEKMSPGSRLIIKDINAASPLVYFNKFHDLVFAREIGNEWTKQNMLTLLSDLNLTITLYNETRTLLYPHYTIIAQKEPV
ncbi:hypothetical protein BFP72_04030 [Reichenbachiella sp. 5M10]|uniref:class I SAM-dependent methyltransferase n=1 Tax=Reichenbachiella sp. 5M10 TaxID=1889772 RepID=UPI000C1548BB|nr:class I SAM-dependent methyltransferase [Reichenbachiella sp. 5M10]PIB34636.1 hypothetical protein BFP72_04030 [Reichenbachiella sp. 5M10]